MSVETCSAMYRKFKGRIICKKLLNKIYRDASDVRRRTSDICCIITELLSVVRFWLYTNSVCRCYLPDESRLLHEISTNQQMKNIFVWKQAVNLDWVTIRPVLYRWHKPRGFYTVSKLIRKEITGMTGGLLMWRRGWSLHRHHTQAGWPHEHGRPVLLNAWRLEYIRFYNTLHITSLFTSSPSQ